jgi:transcriptional regulator with XRE-family HTH domain
MIEESDPSAAINDRIARQVRELRATRRLTLDQLADRAGVSRSMISLIERAESNPTAVILERIARGLGVPLAVLFDDPTAVGSPIARHTDRTSWRDPQTGYLRRNLSPPNYPSAIKLVEVLLPAGAHVAYETGARDPGIEQQIWVLIGTLDVTIAGTTYQLAADDCLALRLDAPTTFHNPAATTTRYLVAITSDRQPNQRGH